MTNQEVADMSNKFLGRILSVEFLTSMVVVIFLGGVAWSSVSAQIGGLQDQASKATVERSKNGTKLESSGRRLERIEANQENLKERFDEQSEDISEQRADIKDILKILREQ